MRATSRRCCVSGRPETTRPSTRSRRQSNDSGRLRRAPRSASGLTPEWPGNPFPIFKAAPIFYAVSAQIMRHGVVDCAREHRAAKCVDDAMGRFGSARVTRGHPDDRRGAGGVGRVRVARAGETAFADLLRRASNDAEMRRQSLEAFGGRARSGRSRRFPMARECSPRSGVGSIVRSAVDAPVV
jgi:hypothetical protein